MYDVDNICSDQPLNQFFCERCQCVISALVVPLSPIRKRKPFLLLTNRTGKVKQGIQLQQQQDRHYSQSLIISSFMVHVLQRPSAKLHKSTTTTTTSSRPKAKLAGSIFMGCIYGAVAFLLFHWHSLLHSTAKNAAVTRSIVQQQQNRQQAPADDELEKTPNVLDKNIVVQTDETSVVRTLNHTQMLTTRPEKPMVIAYAISVIKVSSGWCGS